MNIENSETDMVIKRDEDDIDGLNFLTGKTMSHVNKKAMEGTIQAHVSGGVPNILINIKDLSEESMGELIYFFELACAMSGKLLGVNPFDQPGVEAYKNNMFRLLEKPGYVDVVEEEKPKKKVKSSKKLKEEVKEAEPKEIKEETKQKEEEEIEQKEEPESKEIKEEPKAKELKEKSKPKRLKEELKEKVKKRPKRLKE